MYDVMKTNTHFMDNWTSLVFNFLYVNKTVSSLANWKLIPLEF